MRDRPLALESPAPGLTALTNRIVGYIDAAGLERLGNAMAKNAYGRYLLGLLREPLVR